ncbi:hypothetical protein PAECIP111893_02313 [Paenibacillus plantiphilus]|uniref:Uncharacterized protein n=1 Tax=Paenibacillus plantiphilus TaxID=2905650 RepID=A0ABM9C6D6_9BACL|nr:hypothetical protein [Paenibacillus plantiphilus]CAH1205253.1 hypothetical protein PAECIP111893_02313 [Paenibacillus plantiphilus]
MNHSNDLTRAREQLVEQLVLPGDEKNRFLDAYFAVPGKERTEKASEFLALYTQTLQKLLSATFAHLGELISVDMPLGALRVLIAAITFTTDNPSRKGGVANGA